jgi:hypothetical protein
MKIIRLCATVLALCSWPGLTLAANNTVAQENCTDVFQDAAADWLTGFEFMPSGAGEPPGGKRSIHSDIL